MKNFENLTALAAVLSREHGATINEIIASPALGYLRDGNGKKSRSCVYNDMESLYTNFGLNVYRDDDEKPRGKSGREVVYRIDGDEWKTFKRDFLKRIIDDDDRRLLSFMLECAGSVSPLLSAADRGFLTRIGDLVGRLNVKPTDSKGFFALESTRNLQKLLKAQEERSAVYITYSGETNSRHLFVLKCFSFAGGLYAYVMQSSDGFVYTLSIPRITGVSSLNSKKTNMPAPQTDMKKVLSDPFGIVRDREEFTAVIKLHDYQGLYEKEKEWPECVTIEDEGEGTHIFRVTTSGFYWLKRWVLALGPSAEVISPEWLRDEVRMTVEEMRKRYDENPAP